MKLQMLISGLQVEPEALLSGMKPECDGILVNQCDTDAICRIEKDGKSFLVISKPERGVGRSRNLALSHSEAEVVLFADEDIVYDTGYAAAVVDEFVSRPQADVILFNVRVCEERRTYWNEERKRVRWYNCGRFPAYSIAVRRERLAETNVRYSELFGGGAKYSNGEDSLFLRECASAGLRIETSPVCIGEEMPRESTWFHGYTEKFFFDRGVLFAFLYGKLAGIWALRFVLTKKEMFRGEIKRGQALRLIRNGIKEGKAEKKRVKA